MKSGSCPKCKSRDVYVTKQAQSQAAMVHIEWFAQFRLERYICLACGLSEEFMIEQDLKNPEKLARMRKVFRHAKT